MLEHRRCRAQLTEAVAGDISSRWPVSPRSSIGDTLADPDHAHALPRITVDEPAISVRHRHQLVTVGGEGVRASSPRENGQVPALDSELVGNVDRVVDIDRPGRLGGAGRGELALAVPRRADAPGGLRDDGRQAQVVTRLSTASCNRRSRR